MTRWMGLLAAGVLLGCAGTDSTDDKDGTETDTDITEDGPINLTMEASGDFGCFTPAADAASSTWLTQQIDPAKVGPVDLDGQVVDFQTDDPRGDTEVKLWFGDVVEGTADVTASTTNSDGAIALQARSCDPLSYLALRNPALEDAKPTYKAHGVYAPPNGGAANAEFITVSTDTYLLIPTILGISPDPARSIIAGTAFDCTREPDTLSDIDAGKIEGVQVVVRDLAGNIPEGIFIRYYEEKFPNREGTHTSADGLWTAIDVPPGDYVVEMWGQIEGEARILGTTQVKSSADSINIANIFAGYDGVKVPDDCLVDDSGGDTDSTDTDADTDL